MEVSVVERGSRMVCVKCTDFQWDGVDEEGGELAGELSKGRIRLKFSDCGARSRNRCQIRRERIDLRA
jgi:hypothetical protein